MGIRIEVEVPEEWIQDADQLRADTVEEIWRLGIEQLKFRRALRLYQSGTGSLGFVAELVGVEKRDLIREARSRGIVPPFDERTVAEELAV